jgi:short-subunit dehydrogenase
MSLIGFVGYSAYAPTKWALRGFADSIRNELLKYNINVSIAYPPDTKTPGYAEELKMRPKELNMISPESDSFTSQIVADKLIESLRQGSYHLDTPDILQALLVSLRSGVSPRTNIFLDVLLAPLQQIIAVGYCMFMDYVAKSSAAKSSQNSKKTN